MPRFRRTLRRLGFFCVRAARHWPSCLVLAASLGLTFWAWQAAVRATARLADQRFESQVREMADATRTRIQSYREALLGAAGLFAAERDVAPAQWQQFVARLALSRNFPGMIGMGYAQRVPDGSRAEADTLLRRYQGPGARPPRTASPVYSVILLKDASLRGPAGRSVIGYDMYADPARRRAMRSSQLSDGLAVTEKIPLLGGSPGILAYVPVWKPGRPHATPAQRAANLRGWVYSAVDPAAMLAEMGGVVPPGLHVALYDGRTPDTARLFYSTARSVAAPVLRRDVLLAVDGHPWTLEVTAGPGFIDQFDTAYPGMLLLGGCMGSLLLFAVTSMQGRMRERAQALARKMTASLRASEGNLKDITSTIGEGILVEDNDSRVQFINPHACALLGIEPDWAHGRPAGDLFSRLPGAGGDAEERWMTRGGRRLTVEASRSALWRDGRNTGTITAFRDISRRVEAEQRVRESERFRALFEHSRDALVLVDARGAVSDANQVVCRALRCHRSWLLGRPAATLLSVEADTPLAELLAQAAHAAGAPGPLLEGRLKGQSGDIPVELSLSPIRNGGTPLVLISARTIGDRKREDQLREDENLALEMLVQGHAIHEVLTVIVGAVERHSPHMQGAVMRFDEDVTTFTHCIAPSLPASFRDAMTAQKAGPGAIPSGVAASRLQRVQIPEIGRVASRLSDLLPLSHGLKACVCTPVVGGDGRLLCVLTIYFRTPHAAARAELALMDRAAYLLRIAIERHQSQSRDQYMATHDALTGLPNRVLLQERLDAALRTARAGGRQAAVMFMDLDRFKVINDSLGHDHGDSLLRTVARRLEETAGAGNTVARLGGDEFVLVLHDIDGLPAARRVAEAVLDAVVQPVQLGHHSLVVSTSIGVSLFPAHGDDAEALLKHADTAMYESKKQGRNRVHFYGGEMQATAYQRLMLENGLRRAVADGELELHYQPRVDGASGAVVGFEALVRWRHPEMGLLAPDQFIPLAEETGLIVPLGEWVLRTACRQLRLWREQSAPDLRVSVNLSARQLRQPDLADRVRGILDETGADPRALELEITESMLMQNMDAALVTLDRIRRMGTQLSIDDFGTGYSSLSYLKRLPIQSLKIDRSFVRDLSDDDDDATIVHTIIAMAHSMGLKVVAEGVETPSHVDVLRRWQCDEMQGFRFSRPLAADAANDLLRRQGGVHVGRAVPDGGGARLRAAG